MARPVTLHLNAVYMNCTCSSCCSDPWRGHVGESLLIPNSISKLAYLEGALSLFDHEQNYFEIEGSLKIIFYVDRKREKKRERLQYP